MRRLRVGDVFEVPITDQGVAYGQIAGKQGHAYYFLLFADLFDGVEQPDLNTILASPIALAGESWDSKLRRGEWRVVGHAPVDRDSVCLPVYKISVRSSDWYVESYDLGHRPATVAELARLPLRSFYDPELLEAAIKAVHGVGSWRPEYDALDYRRIVEVSDIRV